MAYTQSDLDSVKTAILSLATGTRVVRVSVRNKTTEYSQAQLNDLRTLRAEIAREIQAAAGRRRFVLTKTSKGL